MWQQQQPGGIAIRVEEEEVPRGGKGTKIQIATADCRILALVPQIRFRYYWSPRTALRALL